LRCKVKTRVRHCAVCKKAIEKDELYNEGCTNKTSIIEYLGLRPFPPARENNIRSLSFHPDCLSKELRRKLIEMEHEGFKPIDQKEWDDFMNSKSEDDDNG